MCPNPQCQDHLQPGRDNLTLRKTYGKHQLRLLRCKTCGTEFSERKGTPLWNSKIDPDTFIKLAETLCEGNTISATVRLCKVHHDTVERIILVTGQHARAIHDQQAVGLNITALEADEGFYGNKSQQLWEATLIDPYSKFMVSLRLGARDEMLIRCLLQDARDRLVDPLKMALFTDGGHGYATLFPEIFGVPYQPKKKGNKGRPPKVKYRVPRMLAHVQLVKVKKGKKLKTLDIRYMHGTTGRIRLATVLKVKGWQVKSGR